MTPTLTGKDYIKVEDTLISKKEIFKGKTWKDTHFALAEKGLFMPPPNLFMLHYSKVRDAAQGKLILYDGDNNEIPKEEAIEHWNYLSSSTDRVKICWTWLDAKFKEKPDGLYLLTDHEVINNNLEPQTTEKLEDCVSNDCYVNLDFNRQGLPTQKSTKKEYQQGNNIYFWHPRDKSVARFLAFSVRAFLSCYRVPGDSDPALGVFAARKFFEDSTISKNLYSREQIINALDNIQLSGLTNLLLEELNK